MRLTCPSCHVELSLEVLLSNEAARHAVARLAQVSLPFGALAVRYIALFRPEKRGLSIERMVKLIEELLPDLERGAIARKGRDWPVTHDTWRVAMETVLTKRDKGTLTLPLTTHGLLYEVMAGLADKHEAALEREREAERRNHRPAGPASGPRDLSEMAESISSGPAPLPIVPTRTYSGPSKAALEKQALIQAALARRAAAETQAQESIAP